MNKKPLTTVYWVGKCALIGALLGCTPSFNWRQVQVEGEDLSFLLPCKPGLMHREVDWGQGSQALSMQGCEAQGLQFTLSWLTPPPKSQVHDLQSLWLRASWASLNPSKHTPIDPQASLLEQVPRVKMSANLHSIAYFEGMGESGLQAHWVWFSKGERLYQAGVYAAAPAAKSSGSRQASSSAPQDALETYFESFH